MYKEEIDRRNTLDQLFKVWKKAQIDECDESFKKTYFNYDVSRKYIFSKDGFLGNEDKAKVLFVCREPHIYDMEKSKDEKNGKFFWVKGCADNTTYYLYLRHPSMYWKKLVPERLDI